jgi:hypothetical protein
MASKKPTHEHRGMRKPPANMTTGACEENQRLLDAFGEIIQELILLHEQQFLAISQGDSEFNRFDILIHMANERKQEARYAYLRHLETHGCPTRDAAADAD